MHLPLFIAKRYLFAKKSHNVINIISIISACGIAIGTAALIIIMSVYNGLQGFITEIYSTYEADLLIAPAQGKEFSPHGDAFDIIKGDPRIAYYCEVVEENVFVRYGNEESVATVRGVDSSFAAVTNFKNFMAEGRFSLYHGEVPEAVMGQILAYNLGARTHFMDAVELYFPSRYRPISMLSPASSLNKEKVYMAGIFRIEQSYDSQYMFVPISVARDLLEYEDEVTSIELHVAPDTDIGDLQTEIKKLLGSGYSVKNRYEQNETLYKMMSSEKLIIFVLLFFIIIVIACNLFGSLFMLIMEKQDDVRTLKSLGAGESLIKKIFIIEGWLISLIGLAAGLVLSLTFCLLQHLFGIIPMPGNFAIKSYPVVVSIWDVVITACGVAALGFVISVIPVSIEKKEKIFEK